MEAIGVINYPPLLGAVSGHLPKSALEVKGSKPFFAKTYIDLVRMVAALASANPEYRLLFRGQTKEYFSYAGNSKIIPSLYRLDKKSRRERDAFDKAVVRLNEAELTLKCIIPFDIGERLKGKVERWAVLQHYEVCSTPLLDMTSSLSVACWFALHGACESDRPVVYVFGLPYPQGPLSFDLSTGIFQLELTTLLPPIAERPVFQNGYLVGRESDLDLNCFGSFDYSDRLIAKIELQDSRDFRSSLGVSANLLFPTSDPFLKISQEIERLLKSRDEFAFLQCEHMFDSLQSDSLNSLFGFEPIDWSDYYDG